MDSTSDSLRARKAIKMTMLARPFFPMPWRVVVEGQRTNRWGVAGLWTGFSRILLSFVSGLLDGFFGL